MESKGNKANEKKKRFWKNVWYINKNSYDTVQANRDNILAAVVLGVTDIRSSSFRILWEQFGNTLGIYTSII